MTTSRPNPGRPPGRTDAGGPDVERLLAAVARTTVEILAGRRPLRQLLQLVSPAVYDRLRAQLSRRRQERGGAAATVVRRVLTTWPTPTSCEATVLIDRGGRTTALALRVERYRGAWRIVEIAAPEAGLQPVPTPPRLEPWPPPVRRPRGTS